jgi:hypothetical protein
LIVFGFNIMIYSCKKDTKVEIKEIVCSPVNFDGKYIVKIHKYGSENIGIYLHYGNAKYWDSTYVDTVLITSFKAPYTLNTYNLEGYKETTKLITYPDERNTSQSEKCIKGAFNNNIVLRNDSVIYGREISTNHSKYACSTIGKK